MSSPRNISFESFLDSMKNPQAKNLVTIMNARLKLFRSSYKGTGSVQEIEEKSKAFQDFMQEMEANFNSHPLWKDKDQDELEIAVEGCEKFMLFKLHDIFFGTCNQDKQRDQALSERLEGLQFVTLQHFDLPAWIPDEQIQQAQEEIGNINKYKAPRDKLVCITNACRRLNQLLQQAPAESQESKSAQGADIFVPLFLYTFCKSNTKQMASNIEFIKRFRYQNRFSGEIGWACTQLEAAINWVETITHDKLKIDKDEFIARMLQAGVTEVEAEVYNHEELQELEQQRKQQQQQNKELQQQMEKQQLDHQQQQQVQQSSFSRAYSNQSPRTDSGQKQQGQQQIYLQQEVAKLSQQLHNLQINNNMQQIRIKQMEEGLLNVDMIDMKVLMQSGEHAIATSPTVLDDLQSQYQYFYAQVKDLKLGDLPKLLDEYKDLALQQLALSKGVSAFQYQFKQQLQRYSSNLQQTQQQQIGQVQKSDSKKIETTLSQTQNDEDDDILTSKKSSTSLKTTEKQQQKENSSENLVDTNEMKDTQQEEPAVTDKQNEPQQQEQL